MKTRVDGHVGAVRHRRPYSQIRSRSRRSCQIGLPARDSDFSVSLVRDSCQQQKAFGVGGRGVWGQTFLVWISVIFWLITQMQYIKVVFVFHSTRNEPRGRASYLKRIIVEEKKDTH